MSCINFNASHYLHTLEDCTSGNRIGSEAPYLIIFLLSLPVVGLQAQLCEVSRKVPFEACCLGTYGENTTLCPAWRQNGVGSTTVSFLSDFKSPSAFHRTLNRNEWHKCSELGKGIFRSSHDQIFFQVLFPDVWKRLTALQFGRWGGRGRESGRRSLDKIIIILTR